MMRATFNFPDELHLRLKHAAQQTDLSLSKLAQTLLNTGLKPIEAQQQATMFAALDTLKGVGKAPVSDLSTTIDATLYGDQGAWRRQPDDDHE